MKRLSFFIIFCLFSWSVTAQLAIIKGKVVDRDSREAIAYTNIGIEGTLYGTASDAEGFFELKIPEDYQQANIYFSAVGYANELIVAGKLTGQEMVTVALSEQRYGIEGIDVAAQSKVLFRIIRTASEKIKENYWSSPLGMKLYYYSKSSTGDEREAVVLLSDQEGYKSPSIQGAFKNRNYQFSEAKRNFDPVSFSQGTTGFDELLEADIARVGNIILNENLLSDYDLQLEKSTVFNGDSVWVIDYKTNKTDLAHTGTYNARKFRGKIFISKTDYGIIRNEMAIEAPRQSVQGRSLAIDKGGNTNAIENITVGYKKIKGKYLLLFIDSNKEYVNKQGRNIFLHQNATVLDLQTSGFPMFKSRDYFEDVTFDMAFWANFVKPRQ